MAKNGNKQLGRAKRAKEDEFYTRLEQMEGDHVTPWREGGHTTPDNLQMLSARTSTAAMGRSRPQKPTNPRNNHETR